MDNERRSNSRVAVELSVKLRLPDGTTSTSDTIGNVSLGGVFIEMPQPLAFGAELGLEFTLPVAPRMIRCRGFVVWSSKTHPERCPGQSGIGVRLMDIGIPEMRILNEFIAGRLDA
jgi:Tfp pilus assembly protein PilZ